MQIAIDRIHPASEPIRKSWDEDKLNELAQSIKEQGLIVPIKVRPNGGGYEVVYGHRRLEATRRNGADVIECIVEGMEDDETEWQALIENMVREDLTAIEIAEGVKSRRVAGYTFDQIAKRLGWNSGTMAKNYLAMVNAPEIVQVILREHPEIGQTGFSRSGAGGLDEAPELRAAVLSKMVKEDLSENQTRKVAESIAAAPSEQAKQMLLEHEYSPVIHDPEHIKARAAIHGANDPLYQNNGPTAQKTWDSTPEVKMAIDGVVEAAKMWTALIAEIRKMVQVGKLAPEGRSFTASKLRSLAQTLNRFADELEQE